MLCYPHILKFIIFEQAAPFHFAIDSVNYAAGSGTQESMQFFHLNLRIFEVFFQ